MRALLVVDVQEIILGKEHAKMFCYKEGIVDKINELIDNYDSKNVFYIKNLMKRNISNLFAPVKMYKNSTGIELCKNLKIVSNNIFDKYKGNAFSNKELDLALKQCGIKEIDIVGVDTLGCVALTAAGAIKRDYDVTIIENATGTIYKKRKKNIYNGLEKMGIKIDKTI